MLLNKFRMYRIWLWKW